MTRWEGAQDSTSCVRPEWAITKLVLALLARVVETEA